MTWFFEFLALMIVFFCCVLGLIGLCYFFVTLFFAVQAVPNIEKILEEIGVAFEEQVLMFNKFLVDVLIPSEKLVIQWDGEYWHTKPKRILLDKSQDAYLKKCGYKVLRITDRQIKDNVEGVYATITKTLQQIMVETTKTF